jgi:uridine kinase
MSIYWQMPWQTPEIGYTNNMEKALIILRGLPGSGKSSLASLIADDENICCADDFFTNDGVYKFDKTKLSEAHSWCQTKARLRMVNGNTPVVIANTCTTEKEMAVYIELAKYVIVENRHNGTNVHNVPENILEAMKKRFEIKL